MNVQGRGGGGGVDKERYAPGSPSKYMTIIYNYFCIKMIFLDFLKEACPRTPLANAWLRHASQVPPPKKIVGPPWQILHTPMNYYWEMYLRIHPGRQLVVCSTLYVYALQNLFRCKKWLKSKHNISWNALHGHCFQILCVHNINV